MSNLSQSLSTEIKACLNSCLLYAESLDSKDLEALAPSHFLIDQVLTTLPKRVKIDVPENCFQNIGKLFSIQ